MSTTEPGTPQPATAGGLPQLEPLAPFAPPTGRGATSPAEPAPDAAPAGLAGGAGPGAPGAPAVPPAPAARPATVPPPEPRGRLWPALLGAAATGALVASLTTAAVLTGREPAPAATTAATSTAEPVPAPAVGTTSWQEVVEEVAGSVVAITVRQELGGAEGSGVIFDAEGLVLTNAHVVEGGRAFDVVLADGRVLDADIVGLDETTDLAVLRLSDPPADLVVATLGDSDTLRVGQEVMAVGNPLGLAGTVTTGIVSALDRPTVTEGAREAVVTNAIQVDAAVNPGNSGGPLFDAAGRVVGINTAIATLSGSSRSGSIGLGFAIPVNLAKQVAEQIVEDGVVSHAFLGVTLADGVAEVEGVARQGAVVGQVVPGSPAEGAGLREGDVIVAVDGRPVASAEALTGYVRARRVGQETSISYVREGVRHEVTVTLAAREEQGRVRG